MSIVQRLHIPVSARSIDRKNLTVDIIASTPSVDSYGTIIDQNGWDLDQFKRNPVITWAHDDRGFTASNGLPIANAIPETVRVENGQLKMRLKFTPEDVHPFGYQVFRMIAEGFLHGVSVGFDPQAQEMTRTEDGQDVPVYTQCKLLETAVVTIPSNDDALIQRMAKKLNREDDVTRIRDMARDIERMGEQLANDPIRWNRSLGQVFDVKEQNIKPATLTYDWVARHVGCDVKQIFQNSFSIPSYRIGGVLSGLRHALLGTTTDEIRNLSWDGNELPPVYNDIQLNSRQTEDFLVDGIAFCRSSQGNFAYRVSPTWTGLDVDFFSHIEAKDFNRSVVNEAWRFAKENNPLQGEAFALSGEFIRATDETWDDCFLDDKNKTALQRIVDRINAKGKDTPNRGVILLGPPGTGKTLSGRVIRNTVKDCSFIWVSTRDFYYGGGFTHAFELAREIAPSVLFFEDIDNWINPGTIDLLKTEMDGIARSSGVVTVLTTNFPERLPQALIDRPGRFHDVLNFNLPADDKRAAMLKKWLDGLSDADVEAAVKRTKGFSGAHMYELANFAKNLQESDDLSVSDALKEAVKKVEEQKSLINEVQLSGSNYRPHRFLLDRLSRQPSVPTPAMPAARTDATPPALTPEDYQRYYERKQPANKAATRFLKKCFRKLGIDLPGDEAAAWRTLQERFDATPDGLPGLNPGAAGLHQQVQDCHRDVADAHRALEDCCGDLQDCYGQMRETYAAAKAAVDSLGAPDAPARGAATPEGLREPLAALAAAHRDLGDDLAEMEQAHAQLQAARAAAAAGLGRAVDLHGRLGQAMRDLADADEEKAEEQPEGQQESHNNVEDPEDPNNPQHSDYHDRQAKAAGGEETTQPPSTTPPAEADPQPARTAFVQLPLPAVLALNRGIRAAFEEAAAEALRQGKSREHLDGIFDALKHKLLGETISQP